MKDLMDEDLREIIKEGCEAYIRDEFEGFEDRLHEDLISDLCYTAGDELVVKIFADYLGDETMAIVDRTFTEWRRKK